MKRTTADTAATNASGVKPQAKKARKQQAPSRPRGRPTKCCPALTKAICAHIAIGIAFKTACAAEGVSEATGHEWMLHGEEGTEPYADFSGAVTRARARGEIELHKLAKRGEKGSSQATWLLERRFRENYGPVNRIEHSGPAGKPIQSETNITVDYSQLSDDELRRLASGGDAT